MVDHIITQFYQRNDGQIFALVEGWKSDKRFIRLISNIESRHYSSRDLYELSLIGFDNFHLFDPNDYSGYSLIEVLEQLGVESGEARMIASISKDCGSELIFESMDEYAKSLFYPILNWVENF